MGLIESHSGPLCLMDGLIQLIPGSYKNEKPNNFTGIDKVHLKCDCIKGSIVNGCREPILYSFLSDNLPGHEIYEQIRIKSCKMINKIYSLSYYILVQIR